MAVNSNLRNLFLLTFLLLFAGSSSLAQEETSNDKPQPKPTTTADTAIPLKQLQVLVKPLTKAELEVEAEAWFELLRKKAGQISAAQLGVKKTNAALNGEGDEQAAVQEATKVHEKAAEESEQTERELTEDAEESLGIDESGEADAAEEDEADAEPSADSAGDLKQELLNKVSGLQDERAGLSDRLEVVLTSLEAKGGDVEEYRKYMTAVSGIDLDTEDASAAWAAVTGWLASKEGGQRWGWNILKFLLILLTSYIVASIVAKVTNWLLERKVHMSQLAEKMISRTIKNVVMLVGLAIALTALEVDITPILAAIGAAGFIVGFALQGTLSNFASGLMILANRPFDVGDVVSAGGVTGVVDAMNLVSTTFKTFDNQTIHVPNNEIWGNVITNITANDQRRVDMEFGVGYDDDFEQAEQIIREVVESHELVLDDPEPAVVMHELADSSVNIVCRPWAKTSDWWTVKTDVTRQVKQRFDQAGISIPYPQTDIHVYEHANSSK
ncbi:mechanosensitive ion channel family protein [Aeoliella sp. ICT_H6.2]|uniref:Mechanosensitive ion channel family protein n=1 Tax=Aeoliella straminimaris TaxID=2954799 RepID=A0A9X2FJK0_9BACT|nr:mechanosensitive ion channel family protein [Aeoliella straminimaris]MCO6047281.1 mechanosensitive ion channel family protein [Aeoliella straminimaris]